MNDLNAKLDSAVDLLNKLYGLPAIAIVMLGCLALGYLLRFIKAFPNDAIPVVCILFGAVLLPTLADARGPMPLRIWLVKNAMLGLIVGCLAWITHNILLSRLEDWLAAKFPAFDRLLNGNPGAGGQQP
jgi:hypothetical protein